MTQIILIEKIPNEQSRITFKLNRIKGIEKSYYVVHNEDEIKMFDYPELIEDIAENTNFKKEVILIQTFNKK